MKKWIAIVLLAVMLFSLAACGQKKEEPAAVGGWTLNDSGELSAEAKAAFDKAMEGLMGVNYTPVALLGTQLVSGTNYSILAEATVVYPDAQPYYAVVTVYEDLQGKAEIRNIAALDLGRIAESGEVVIAEAPEEQLLGGWTVDRDGSVEVEDAVLHLASQVVSGTNHCVLCKGWTRGSVSACRGLIEKRKCSPAGSAFMRRSRQGAFDKDPEKWKTGQIKTTEEHHAGENCQRNE